MSYKNIIITGPTATGKTKLAVSLAKKFNGEIVSADSRQVYRDLNVGTGKDLNEYGTGENAVPYHLIDIVDPDDEYNLMCFRQDAPTAIAEILKRNHLPIIEGGTPLYIDSLISDYKMTGGGPDGQLRNSLKKLSFPELLDILENISPDSYLQLKESNNRNRVIRAIERDKSGIKQDAVKLSPDTQWLIIGVYYHRQEVHKRIEVRLNKRFDEGIVEEVRQLHEAKGLSWEKLEYFGLEYKYLAYYLQNKLSYDEMKDQLLIKIRQFAKRQDIWFRKMEREGHVIHWVPEGNHEEAGVIVKKFIDDTPLPPPKIRISDIDYGKK